MTEATLKIVLVGDSSVGKSCLMHRFCNDTFTETYLTTIGVDFLCRNSFSDPRRPDQPLVRLQIWDTAGQERFRTITSAYYRGAHIIIMVYDATYRPTYGNVETVWLDEVRRHAAEDVMLAVIATHSDDPRKCVFQQTGPWVPGSGDLASLPSDTRKAVHSWVRVWLRFSPVTELAELVVQYYVRLDDWASRHPEIPLFEVDSRTGRGVQEAFANALAVQFRGAQPPPPPPPPLSPEELERRRREEAEAAERKQLEDDCGEIMRTRVEPLSAAEKIVFLRDLRQFLLDYPCAEAETTAGSSE
eukprot:TRINITY_DN3607_c0_g1_i1.p1 TRINITY_DN3607_c0_g1~~TRINITY_DN3607_c0_g1_i1.p1  ORF type:complete len:317 (+),score=66.08 TRINITY_DN3607_c0_g1_i1:47-952(+)